MIGYGGGNCLSTPSQRYEPCASARLTGRQLVADHKSKAMLPKHCPFFTSHINARV